MAPKFSLGKITIKEEAAYALSLAGQDAEFFIQRHASGHWEDADHLQNEQALAEGCGMVMSKHRTLRGHEILVATFLDKKETHLFCPPNSVIKHIELPDLACWYPGGVRPMQQPHGNGSGKVEISQQDMGGWVRVFPGKMAGIPEDLHVYLSQTLTEWFRQHSHLRLRCVVPINRDGTTVELHAWYDAHLFAPTTAGPEPEPKK